MPCFTENALFSKLTLQSRSDFTVNPKLVSLLIVTCVNNYSFDLIGNVDCLSVCKGVRERKRQRKKKAKFNLTSALSKQHACFRNASYPLADSQSWPRQHIFASRAFEVKLCQGQRVSFFFLNLELLDVSLSPIIVQERLMKRTFSALMVERTVTSYYI